MKTLTIKSTSWHYRLHVLAFTMFNIESYGPRAYLRGERWSHSSRTLCGYFWTTLTLTLLLPFWLIAGVLIVLPVALGILAGEKIHSKYREARPRDPDKPYKIDAFFDTVAAGKKRACPLITVE